MPVTAPQVQLAPRHLSQTTLTSALSNSAPQMTVASGAIFDALPTAALLTDGVNTEVVSVDSLASGTTYNITRAIEPATAASAFPANTTQVKLIIAAETVRRLQRGLRERTTGVVNALEYGARGDGLWVTGTMANGSATLGGSLFASSEAGQSITIRGAGAAGADLVTTIATWNSTTTVVLTAPAGTTQAAALATWHNKVSRVSVTAGGTTCTLVGPWTPADVGKAIVVTGAAAAGALATTITGYNSGTQINIGATASRAITDQGATYGTDDTAALQAALAVAGGGRGGRVMLPALTYLISGTLNIPSHSELWGTSLGNFPTVTTDQDYHMGACLVWAGAQNGTMVRLFNVQGVIVHGVAVNAENVQGVTGFLIDSDNVISTQQTVLEYFACWNCAVGVQWGHAADISAGQNTQCDTVNLRRFWISAPSLTTSAVGIIVNTSNSQISRIEQGILQNLLRGIHFQRHGGITTVDRVIGGAILGTNATFIQTSHFTGELVISNCQAESCTFFLRALDRINDADSGPFPAVGTTLNPITLLCCHLDTPILVTGAQTIITIGCSNSAATTFTYNSLGNVISIGDVLQNVWTMTQGALYKLCTFLGAAVLGTGIPETSLPRLTVGPPIGGSNPTIQLRHLTAVQSVPGTGWGGGNIATGATATATIGCQGAVAGDTCIATPDTAMGTGLIWNAYCNTPNAVTVRMTNVASAQQPAGATWRVTVLGY